MSKVNLEEIFFDFVSVASHYVSESDQVQMYIEILRELEDKGHNIKILHGNDDAVDEALDEIIDDDDYEEDYE